MSADSAFYRLSTELLEAIVDASITMPPGYWRIRNEFPHLKALRLTSTRFAYLPHMMKTLFSGIRLVPTPEDVEHFSQADIKYVAPYVKKVTFIPLFDNWTVTFDEFHETVLVQIVQKYIASHWKEFGSYNKNYETFIKDHWEGDFPASEQEIQTEFDKFHEKSMAIKALFSGAELTATWSRVLKSIKNLDTITFAEMKEDIRHAGGLPEKPDFDISHHMHTNPFGHDEIMCWRNQASFGDSLFTAAMTALADSGQRVHHLGIECPMTGMLELTQIPGWKNLDLSEMKSFSFIPKIEEDSYKDHEKGKNGADGIVSILEKCKGSLEEFTYGDAGNECEMYWPGKTVIPLSKLKSISLGCGCIRPENFARWIAEMPSLSEIQLEGSRLTSQYADWFYIFDAIRDHKNGLNVHFDQIISTDYTELSIRHSTHDFEALLAEQDADEDIYSSVALYLSGKLQKNRSMQEHFYLSDIESSEAEDDDDEEEEEEEEEEEK